MADYDAGEVTERERRAANNQTQLGRYSADTIKNQFNQQASNYDRANARNRQLADVELTQTSRKSESDRFNAMRDLQNAAMGLYGSMNQAMNGSTVGNLMRELESRNDRDNDTYWSQLQTNWDQVNNAYEESANQNAAARDDAASNAEQALRSLQGDTAANLNNINPNLYVEPGTGDTDFGANGFYEANKSPDRLAQLSGYITPAQNVTTARRQSPRNQLSGSNYFGRLINQLNGVR